ncbi:suppressor of fused homolog isoform X2 [Halyomorpha halys]|uniref:suppressor of fused homolog isoform X2 n=1 Tax=Halyomorpha halys TaxID=286706 RepID=UPI0034D250D2
MMEDIEGKKYSPPCSSQPVSPPGLEALYVACREIYPEQPNPLQVAAVIKYWLGGPDPLDYISMYFNRGNADLGIPPHWHYISFGLSDLHGDGRVHEKTGPGEVSGFGFELTFRLKREPGETSPPTWPAQLLQSLAKYVFLSGNVLYAGDHVSWHKALDSSESLIEHILLMEDPQFKTVLTPNGEVSLIQVIGVTKSELECAQRWSPHGVIEILKKIPGGACGGEWLVTDMRRGMSMFELDPNSPQLVKEGIEKDGSNLSGVAAVCSWKESREAEEDKYGEIVENSPTNNKYGSFSQGRVMHGRHFSFKAVTGNGMITFVGEGVSGKSVDTEHPYVATGPWLQVLIPDSFAEQMASDLDVLDSDYEKLVLPKVFSWPERSLSITIESGCMDSIIKQPVL